MGRGARRRFGFPFHAGCQRLRRVSTIFRWLVLPRGRQGGGGEVGGARPGSRVAPDVIAAHVVAAVARVPGIPAGVPGALALKVDTHLHFHHLGRALDEVGPRA